MSNRATICSAATLLAGTAGLAAAGYAVFASVNWYRYGHPDRRITEDESDALLDRFMPSYEAVERHHRVVHAPAHVALAAACELDLSQSTVVRTLFGLRSWALRSKSRDDWQNQQRLLVEMKALGWRILAEVPGRELVVGAVTRPWLADVVFQGIPPDKFAAFDQPGFVKIAWTLRADPISTSRSVIRTETRVSTTDPISRKKFRRYWSLVLPGIMVIRRVLTNMAKWDAEQRAGDEVNR